MNERPYDISRLVPPPSRQSIFEAEFDRAIMSGVSTATMPTTGSVRYSVPDYPSMLVPPSPLPSINEDSMEELLRRLVGDLPEPSFVYNRNMRTLQPKRKSFKKEINKILDI